MTSKSLSLYELSAETLPLEAALEAAGGEETEDNKALVQRLEELQLLTQAKVDHYGYFYKSLEAMAKAIKDEEARLSDRRKAIENKMQRLRDAAKEAMEARGVVKIEGKSFTVSIQKNGGLRPMTLRVAEERIPDKWFRVRRELDLRNLRADLERGDPDAAKVAEFEEPGTSVRIR
jgi:hypothetical protein